MNSRDYKINGQNVYSHIFNRGNRKEDIFLDENDFEFFTLRLKQNLRPDFPRPRWMSILPENSFSIISYALLPNHFHFIIRQNSDIPPSKLMSRICTSYSKYYNKKYKKVGHIFQDQFKQKMIKNDNYLLWLSAYIHQNPRLHNITDDARKYKKSSYREYLLKSSEGVCDAGLLLGMLGDSEKYEKFVESSYAILEQNKNIRKFCEN